MRSRVLMVLALLGATAPALSAERWIYIQKRDDGVTVFTDQKPAQGPYKKISARGRPTASASCKGLTRSALQQRAALYDAHVRKYAEKHALSPRLVDAVMRVESCYDPRAVSRAGARGLMQLMPGTARQLGVNDVFDPEQNIEGGARYLAAMLERFGGSLRLALAAYNAGPEAVTAYNGVPPYPETKNYVSRILSLYQQ